MCSSGSPATGLIVVRGPATSSSAGATQKVGPVLSRSRRLPKPTPPFLGTQARQRDGVIRPDHLDVGAEPGDDRYPSMFRCWPRPSGRPRRPTSRDKSDVQRSRQVRRDVAMPDDDDLAMHLPGCGTCLPLVPASLGRRGRNTGSVYTDQPGHVATPRAGEAGQCPDGTRQAHRPASTPPNPARSHADEPGIITAGEAYCGNPDQWQRKAEQKIGRRTVADNTETGFECHQSGGERTACIDSLWLCAGRNSSTRQSFARPGARPHGLCASTPRQMSDQPLRLALPHR